jgi:hypothetical protein
MPSLAVGHAHLPTDQARDGIEVSRLLCFCLGLIAEKSSSDEDFQNAELELSPLNSISKLINKNSLVCHTCRARGHRSLSGN